MAAENTSLDCDDVERDMPVHQRGLVDTCFEEGQYEAGIAVLEQLRSPKYRPSGPHVRQLVYIALRPPPPAEDPNTASHPKLESGQPSRMHASLAPSPAASDAALRLLHAFAGTNTPAALLHAFPQYETIDRAGKGASRGQGEEDDSFIARESIRIRNARDCWAVLHEGFLQRKDDAAAIPRTNPGSLASSRRKADRGSSDADASLPSPVDQHAWGVLDWLLSLFEKDEMLAEQSGQPSHSPLLLSQIPLPRAGNARWDIAAPLDVVFHCLHQTDSKRKRMGSRLFTLLIHLASTTLIDLPMFLNAASSRVFALPAKDLASLLAALPVTMPVLQFRLVLCKSYLTETRSSAVPQTRAQPRRKQAEVYGNDAPPPKDAASNTILRKFPPISSAEILRLVESRSHSDASDRDMSLQVKLELARSFWLLQKQIAVDARDTEWPDVLRSGRLKEAFQSAFVDTSENVKKEGEGLRNVDRLLTMICAG
ncbi:uncharacterized protein LAESUDRAFT_748862 [Laetiporus sulphureus 93-53]|uniref:Uncharacterized protein n=1 Tax=Laetiporus sulphureus 93-53 TaxID=1314785 RepID=A0A165F3W2_9APHY|nr:uncharacterized protein LAESUDRAFT_748862 [Laetiporus sulphureus 93-53]KZT08330.1 hypothetical protein LAESUDRAFT_748862 [Laetiporus sulphureus 93-53]